MSEPRVIDALTQAHIDRFLAGKKEWNVWAEKKLAEKAAFEAAGIWQVKKGFDDQDRFRTLSDDREVQGWLDETYVDFCDLHFFAEQASEAKSKDAEESVAPETSSVKPILVPGLTINYNGFIFPSGAGFSRATFEGRAGFDGATFKGWAGFSQVDFLQHVNFGHAKFEKEANFEAIEAKRAFNLAGVRFGAAVPNFSQAHFTEAPRLDHIEVRPAPEVKFWTPEVRKLISALHKKKDLDKYPRLKRWRTRFLLRNLVRDQHQAALLRHANARFDNAHERDEADQIEGNSNDEAYYRALKRLAIQAHDHDNEMSFFAGEMRARRHVLDFPGPFKKGFASCIRYWAGVLYEITSDFGRSLWRPFAWWMALFLLSASLYHSNAAPKALELCQQRSFAAEQTGGTALSPGSAALIITAKNSLLFLGGDRTEKLKRAYGCLYGASPLYHKIYYKNLDRDQTGVLQSQISPRKFNLAPNVPGIVSFFGVINAVLSLIFIFLFLLAVRNQFKIK